jgi:archaellum component FlaC
MLNVGLVPPGPAGLLGVLVIACAAAFWWFRHLPKARELRRHALRVEALRPALAGELLAVLDRSARPMGSEALVERMAQRVAAPVVALPSAEVIPSRPAVQLLFIASVAAILLAFTAPVVTTAGPRAVVGDITLRYLYPTYTGLSAIEIPNSNGDIHAPPGTRVEVSARTERQWSTAILQVFGQDLPVELGDGRSVRGALEMRADTPPDAVWHFQFGADAVSMLSPDYRIVVDPDLPPQVTVDVAKNHMTAKLDQPLSIPWHAHDDYGIRKVVIEVTEGGVTREVALRDPLGVPRDLDDHLNLTPADLGLRAGSTAQLRVKSWDNDEVSGSKAGRSSAIQLDVSGRSGDMKRLLPKRKELRDALVLALAGFLTDRSPAFDAPAAGLVWVAEANLRYQKFDSLVAADWAAGEGVEADQVALREVADKRRSLFALVGSIAHAERLGSTDSESMRASQAANIIAIEGAVLLYDEMLQRFALHEVSDLARQMANEAAEMKVDFKTLDGKNAADARARLDQLRRMLSDLSQAAAAMGDGGLRQFTNDNASRLSDLITEAQKALAEGRYEDAQTMMQRIAEQMQQFSDGLQDQQKRQSESSDAVGDAMKDLDKQLEQLQADQAKLREQTEQAQEQHGSSMEEAIAVWKEIEERAGSAARGAADVVTASGPLGGGAFRGAGDLQAEADGLLDAARSRNPERTRGRAEGTEAEAGGLLSMLTWAAKQRGAAAGTAAMSASISKITSDAGRVLALLDKLQSQSASPQLQQALEQLADKQGQISDRAQKLSKDAKDVARNLPMKAPGLEQGTRQAAAESGRAAEAMKEGDPMSATGGQQATEDGIREARAALKQAGETMQSMAQQGESGAGEGDGEKSGKETEGPASMEMPIPAPEEFETPEAYRRALLEGMQGTVPDQYRSTNLRYYEELVRQ